MVEGSRETFPCQGLRQGSLKFGLRWISGQNRNLRLFKLQDIISMFPIASCKGKVANISVHIPDLALVLVVYSVC